MPVVYVGPSSEVVLAANETRTLLMGVSLETFYPPPYYSIFVFPGRFEFFRAQGWDLEVLQVSNVTIGQNTQTPRLRYTVRNNTNHENRFRTHRN